MNFECHITIPREYADKAAHEMVQAPQKWSTSNITDDPVLGPGPKFYFTRYDTDYLSAYEWLRDAVIKLQLAGVPVIREKIELIMYDRRFDSPK